MSRVPDVLEAPAPLSSRAWIQWINVALYLGGLVTIVVAVNVLAHRPAVRLQVDATKTRAYSLSDQTRKLLASLDGRWTIALVASAEDTDRAVSRQVDEVLRRFDEATPSLEVTRIDPTDPASIGAFERLIGDLRFAYADRVREYEAALESGDAALRDLLLFAREQAVGLQTIAAALPEELEATAGLRRRAQLLGLLADEGDAVTTEIANARAVDAERPIPDYEGARSILATALGQWAQELADTADLLRGVAVEATTEPRAQQQVLTMADRYAALSQRLAVAADPLAQLPRLELSDIGRRLQRGDAAVVLGPRGAAVVPGDQLLPRANLKVGASSVSFDQRFRGEQLIAAAMRSLLVDRMPLVVFVHAEDRSLLRSNDRDVDLVGVREQLDASRYDVDEWIVHQTQRPVPADGQPVVWVIVPPPQRAGIAAGRPEQQLLEATSSLIDEGEPVLLSLYPSLASRYGRQDPWSTLPARIGLVVDTSTVIYESALVGEEQIEIERGQAIRDYPGAHPVARAVQGQQCYLSLPMPIRSVEANGGAAVHQALALVEPTADRWLEQEWMQPTSQIEPPADRALEAAAAVVMATERPAPGGGGRQRIVTVGSGGWMLSYVADVAVNVGGERFALVNPGNHELMLSSVAWLAGMDDLIAAGPAGQQASRLQGVGPGVQRGWFWLTVATLPGLCLALSFVTWLVRRV